METHSRLPQITSVGRYTYYFNLNILCFLFLCALFANSVTDVIIILLKSTSQRGNNCNKKLAYFTEMTRLTPLNNPIIMS